MSEFECCDGIGGGKDVGDYGVECVGGGEYVNCVVDFGGELECVLDC